MFEVDAGQRLFHLQRPVSARLGIRASPIIEAEGDVTVLLHFKHHQIAQRVDGPGWNEDAVAWLRPEAG